MKGSTFFSRKGSLKTIIFLPYILVSIIISTRECENHKLKLIFLDRIVGKLSLVRKLFMQRRNSHRCTVNKPLETFTTDDDNVFPFCTRTYPVGP